MNFTPCTCEGCGGVGVKMPDSITRCPDCLMEAFSIEEIEKFMKQMEEEEDEQASK